MTSYSGRDFLRLESDLWRRGGAESESENAVNIPASCAKAFIQKERKRTHLVIRELFVLSSGKISILCFSLDLFSSKINLTKSIVYLSVPVSYKAC